MRNPDSQDLQFILGVLTGGYTLAAIQTALDAIAAQTRDRKLRIYLNRVYMVLASAEMKDMDPEAIIPLPLDTAPYSELVEYCRQRI